MFLRTLLAVPLGMSCAYRRRRLRKSLRHVDARMRSEPLEPRLLLVLAPSISFPLGSIRVPETGALRLEINASGEFASGQQVQVTAETRDGTAVAGIDFTRTLSTLSFSSVFRSRIFEVPLLNDSVFERDKAFTVALRSPTNGATIGRGEASVTITSEDPLPRVSIEAPAFPEVLESGSLTLRVMLSNPSEQDVTVEYETVDGTAFDGADYERLSGRMTFAAQTQFRPGETSKTLTFSTRADSLDEEDETVKTHILFATNSNVDSLNHEVELTIRDDDSPPSVSFGIPSSIPETDFLSTNLPVTLTLSSASGKEISLDYATRDGSALAGLDYLPLSGTLKFLPAGKFGQPETSKTINISVLGDNTDEPDQSVFFRASNLRNVTQTSLETQLTIRDDDPTPTVTLRAGELSGVSEGPGGASFTVTLSNPSDETVTVDYATENGLARAGDDFVAQSGTLRFRPASQLIPAELTKTITVPIIGDHIDELDEPFDLVLRNYFHALGVGQRLTISIRDDDQPPVVQIRPGSPSGVIESATAATFTVELSGPSGKTITVEYATFDGTAAAGQDYTTESGTLTFLPEDFRPAETTKTITVPLMDDSLDEPDERFVLRLGRTPANATIGALDSAEVMIMDDDLTPVASIDGPTMGVTEGDGGTQPATFVVRLDRPSGRVVTVQYSSRDGTAVVGADYEARAGTVVFATGSVLQTIEVLVVGDTAEEAPAETFSVELRSPINAILDPDRREAVATIRDNDERINDNIDLQAVSLRFNDARNGLDFNYAVNDGDLEAPATLAFYWSEDAAFQRSTDRLGFETRTETIRGSYTKRVECSELERPPAKAKYLLGVLDPIDAIGERYSDNNVREVKLEFTLAQLHAAMPSAPAVRYYESLKGAMEEFGIDSYGRRAAFFGQLAVESNQLRKWNELYTTRADFQLPGVKRLPYTAKNAEDYFNYWYSDRPDLGNGDYASGDGYKYRGRGPIQLTGRSNYAAAGAALGLDLLANPDWVSDTTRPEVGFRVAGWYWRSKGLNELADTNPVPSSATNRLITKKVNGGYNHLADRFLFYRLASSVWW